MLRFAATFVALLIDYLTATYRNIFLTGMPGSGKSYLAPLLTAAYGGYAADLDQEIVSACGRTIPEIFADGGEAAFRETERRVLEQQIARYPAGMILACGGGTPCFGDNLQLMQRSGRVVYLQAELPWLEQNILRSSELRPLLDTINLQQRLRELLQARGAFYGQADYTFPAGQVSVRDFEPLFR